MNAKEVAEKNVILSYRVGSSLYGTNTPDSDIDYSGVFMPDENMVFGFERADEVDLSFKSKREDGKNNKDAVDVVLYEFRKFAKLALDNNPNILEQLFVNKENLVYSNSYGDKLLKYGYLFPHKGLKEKFMGYAFSQKHKMVIRTDNFHALENAHEWLEENMKTVEDGKRLLVEFLPKKLPFMSVRGDNILIGDLNFQRHFMLRKVKKMIAERLSKATNRKNLLTKYGYDCYHKDTEFLTKNGWKLYDEIENNEELGTLNPKSFKLEFQVPCERVKKLYNGIMYENTGKYTSICVTPNHRMFVSPCHRNSKNNFSTKYINNINDWKIIPLYEILNNSKSHFHITSQIKPNNIDYCISDNYLKLIGMYLSDGTVSFRNNKIKSIRIYQTNHGKKAFFDLMNEIINDYEFKIYSYQRNDILNETIWDTHNNIKNQIVDDCGYGTNKHLPIWIFKLSKRQIDLLLNALFLGDGTNKNEFVNVYYTNSKKLANGVQILAFLSGRKVNLCGKYDGGMYQVSYKKEIDDYDYLVFSENLKEFKRRSNNKLINNGFKKFKYNDYIVCFSVPNELLITRYKGKIAIQGNTKFASHLVRLMLEGKELLTTERLTFPLKEKQLILDIKLGKYKMTEVLRMAEEFENELNDLVEKSKLPSKPRYNEVQELVKNMLKQLYE